MEKYYIEFCLNGYWGLQYDAIFANSEEDALIKLNEEYPNAFGIEFIKNKSKIKKLEKNKEDYGCYALEV